MRNHLSTGTTGGGTGGGSGAGGQSYYATRSDAFLDPGYAYNYDEFAQNSLAGWAVNNAPAISADYAGGTVKFTAGASLIFKNAGVVLTSPRTQNFHLGGRMLRLGAIGAGDKQHIALGPDANNRIEVGVVQPMDATRYVFAITTGGSVTYVVSTVLVGVVFVDMEIWADDTGVYGSINDETPVTVTTNKALLPNVALYERHGIDATSGSLMYLDNVYWACDRQAS